MQMPRRNPFLFKREEYSFLHQIYLRDCNDKGKVFEAIKKKGGMGLEEKEIMYVKEKFQEWKDKNPKGLSF